MPILLYDEKCSICRRFVSWMVRADHAAQLRIAPLQSARGDAVRAAHPEHAARDSALFMLTEDAPPLARSDAILAVGELVGGPWRWAARAGRMVPRPIRDWAYRTFAGNRKYFGWMGLDELDPASRERLL